MEVRFSARLVEHPQSTRLQKQFAWALKHSPQYKVFSHPLLTPDAQVHLRRMDSRDNRGQKYALQTGNGIRPYSIKNEDSPRGNRETLQSMVDLVNERLARLALPNVKELLPTIKQP